MAIYLQIPQWFDSNGDPLAGGQIFSFEPGTTTPKSTYTDVTGATPHPNPAILDSAGRLQIWLDGAYKLEVRDSVDTLVLTIDNLDLAASGVGSLDTTITLLVNAQAGQPRLTAGSVFAASTEARSVYAKTTIPFGTSNGLTAVAIGDLNEGYDIWAPSVGILLDNDSHTGQHANRLPRLFNPTTRDVIITALGGNFDGTGQIQISTLGWAFTA